MYITLFMNSYKSILTVSMRLTSSPSETVRALLYKYSFVSNKLYTFILLDYESRNFLFLFY